MEGISDDFGSDDFDDADLLALAEQVDEEQQRALNPDHQPSRSATYIELSDNDEYTPSSRPARSTATEKLRQTTLDGRVLAVDEHVAQVPHAYPLKEVQRGEEASHHKLDAEAMKTWIYPTNVSFREYQYNIVKKALLTNLLAALPTGLGKTFIAATVILNWYRWAPEAQIVFLAPTKPLVAQQIEACYNTVGIPRSQTAIMTGGEKKPIRMENWEEKRVFFCTPQTHLNDMKSGICDPKKLVLLVVDEAHRTSGSYAYGEVVKYIRLYNSSFRVLALTATPGSNIDAVQGVISALGIARIEIRTDESLDIAPYVQKREIEVMRFSLPPEITHLEELFAECLKPMLRNLNRQKICHYTDPTRLTAFGVHQSKQAYIAQHQSRMSKGQHYQNMKMFSNLSSLASHMSQLQVHSARLFYNRLTRCLTKNQGETEGKAVKAIKDMKEFKDCMIAAEALTVDPNFSGHPKLDYMVTQVLTHFSDALDDQAKEATRIIIFTSFRDSAEEICRILKRHQPMIRPHIFVGQQEAKGQAGMPQKEQLEIVEEFKVGKYNTLVATCIGEEGLDIGQVDLIVNYDSTASPIRLIQRMGRTGRKRDGRVLVLLCEGREATSYDKALDADRWMQKAIATSSEFRYEVGMNRRIIPYDIKPEPVQMVVDIPVENTQPAPEPRTKPKNPRKKAPKKTFFMPEGVETGFTSAALIGKDGKEAPKGLLDFVDFEDSSDDALKKKPQRRRKKAPVQQKLSSSEDEKEAEKPVAKPKAKKRVSNISDNEEAPAPKPTRKPTKHALPQLTPPPEPPSSHTLSPSSSPIDNPLPTIPATSSVGLLTRTEETELVTNYTRNPTGATEEIHYSPSRFPASPALQRTASIPHGTRTKTLVRAIRKINNADDKSLERFKDKGDLEMFRFKPAGEEKVDEPTVEKEPPPQKKGFSTTNKAFKPVRPRPGMNLPSSTVGTSGKGKENEIAGAAVGGRPGNSPKRKRACVLEDDDAEDEEMRRVLEGLKRRRGERV